MATSCLSLSKYTDPDFEFLDEEIILEDSEELDRRTTQIAQNKDVSYWAETRRQSSEKLRRDLKEGILGECAFSQWGRAYGILDEKPDLEVSNKRRTWKPDVGVFAVKTYYQEVTGKGPAWVIQRKNHEAKGGKDHYILGPKNVPIALMIKKERFVYSIYGIVGSLYVRPLLREPDFREHRGHKYILHSDDLFPIFSALDVFPCAT